MSLSLVSYAASSDEDSDYEDKEETITMKPSQSLDSASTEKQNGQQMSKSLNLPQPKHVTSKDDEDNNVGNDNFKLNLPAPKKSHTIVEEDDDEFLHKKVQPSLVEKPTKLKPENIRKPVRITIPSLSEFADDDDLPKQKCASIGPSAPKPSGLLGMLPPPKFNAAFGKPKEKPASTTATTSNDSSSKPTITKTTSLIPHTVANKIKQAAAKSKPNATVVANKKTSLGLNYNNSDDSDNEEEESGGDFFSLNTDDKLPEVSASEINAMVAKKATQMAEFSKNLNEAEQSATEVEDYSEQASSSYVPDNDQINIEALIGARAAKRSRKEDIQFIDISQDQVILNQDEWRRNQLQGETQYQPTGRLVVGDPGTGTKKKHQITYLAYQAKANEAELQAMWATNRQSRRQTQSKYGF
ncbi:proline-rich protein PRCC [Contarinia nasturtii]|uniref:proline-rich protein PRCC n=1 Tax=Contarinia nasturtii TaxID=265458 RepID=UPI0012D3C08D|nr:proline-rich protein PRCC [Contarinia nasturtii]